ncbi:hypothetical protein Tco_1174853 [Tanacetum coccineum]
MNSSDSCKEIGEVCSSDVVTTRGASCVSTMIEDVEGERGNVIVNGNRVGCSYKEFLACNPKEYNGKGGAIVLTRWIEKMESVHDMSGCSIDQKVKYTAGSFVGKALTCHEDVKVGNLSCRYAMVGAWPAAYTDRFHELVGSFHICNGAKDYTEGYFDFCADFLGALTDEAGRREYGYLAQVYHLQPFHALVGLCSAHAYNYKRGLFASGIVEVLPRNVNPVNARNLIVRACYECVAANGGQGHRNQGNQARGRAFMLGAEEARQDSNVVTGLEPSDLGFIYEIEIASGHLVEIDKVIKGCKLEIEGHVFDIDLIPFGHRSFDVIIDGKVLRVLGERPEEKARLLMSAKANERKQEEIVVLIPGAMPVAKSPYRLAPFELKELSGQLRNSKTRELIQVDYLRSEIKKSAESADDDIPKTALWNSLWTFQKFIVMPFVLTNAPGNVLDLMK